VQTVSLFDAKTHLSGLVEQIVSGAEPEITTARHGRPVAHLVPVPPADTIKRIGIVAGLCEVPDDIDALNSDVLNLMVGA